MMNFARVPYSAAPSIITLILGCTAMVAAPLVLAADSGDAPASYGMASHIVSVGGPYLGDVLPDDNDPQSGESAMGDDENGIDDEDGVFAFPTLVQNGKAYSTNVFATNLTEGSASLVGWVDFDGSGAFDADEAATLTVPAGTRNGKFKLLWPDLSGISNDFLGRTYARFRITTGALTSQDSQGIANDGEVEDYSFEILQDSDGDERPDITDTDNDNDGIPDAVEGTTADTDNDGAPNYLDVDSDGDGIPDYIEAGETPAEPVDSDSDGTPDYLDLDSDGDGVPDSERVDGDADNDSIPDDVEGAVDTDSDGVLDRDDLDSDNDTIPDAIEAQFESGMARDTDGDGIPDYLDGDSDNDGILDIYEGHVSELDVTELDTNNDGRVDSGVPTGVNGLVNVAETEPDSGVLIFSVADSDGDGIRDYRELDSDADGVFDLLEAGGTDTDANGLVDSNEDQNGDGVIDSGNLAQINGGFPDVDSDGILDFQDTDADGSQPPVGGTDDSGAVDGGTDDSGAVDGGTDDSGAVDGGTDDSGAVDGGTDDSGAVDGGTDDSGAVDGGTDDSGAVDGGTDDSGAVDGGIDDGGAVDGGAVDGGTSDGNGDDPTPGDDDPTSAPQNPDTIKTGLSGGAGCSIAPPGAESSRTDGLLIWLVMCCIAVLGRKYLTAR